MTFFQTPSTVPPDSTASTTLADFTSRRVKNKNRRRKLILMRKQELLMNELKTTPLTLSINNDSNNVRKTIQKSGKFTEMASKFNFDIVLFFSRTAKNKEMAKTKIWNQI